MAHHLKLEQRNTHLVSRKKELPAIERQIASGRDRLSDIDL